MPADPVPSFFRSSPVNNKLINLHFPATNPLQPSKPHHSYLKRHVSSACISVGCGLGSRATLSDDDRTESPEFQWEEEEKWHVVAKVYDETPRRKIYNSSVSGESDSEEDVLGLALPLPPPPPTVEKKKRRARKKKTASKTRTSTSSADSGLFSSEGRDEGDDEETETLVSSSRSLSSDSSPEFNPHLETIREVPLSSTRRKKSSVKKVRRCVSKGGRRRKVVPSSPESESPARLSMFQRLIPCTVDGKVRESFAVVKKSEDPYEDFKRSMMEMILEKQMFDEKDLEQLLHCFLSLNARQHHVVIVQAFSEIWEALFCRRSTSRCVSRAL